MRLDRTWIESRLPHQGRMCLLDEVLAWDLGKIRCRSASHRAADHPLRARGRLGVACGIEYAAQTMALHGALIASRMADDANGKDDAARAKDDRARTKDDGARTKDDGARAGFLASVRGVRFAVLRIDDVPGDLLCEAIRVAGDRDSVVYEFRVAGAITPGDEPQTLLSGRATIALQDSVPLAP